MVRQACGECIEPGRDTLFTGRISKRDERDWRNTKFGVPGLKFQKPRTSDLEPSPGSPVTQVSQFALVARAPDLSPLY